MLDGLNELCYINQVIVYGIIRRRYDFSPDRLKLTGTIPMIYET